MQLDDIRVAESITAAELAVGDFHLVFDASANKWKRLVHSEGNKENKPVPGTPVKAVKAFVETALSGTNNDVRWTAAQGGVAGGAASIAYFSLAVATTAAAASGSEVAVQIGTKARMTVSGTLSPDATGTLFYAGEENGKPHWTSDGVAYSTTLAAEGDCTAVRYGTDAWTVVKIASGEIDYFSQVTSAANFPDGLTFDSPVTGTGTPTVAAGVSSATQVIAAVAADAASAALMVGTNKSGNDGTGAVAALSTTLLSSGTAGVDGTVASEGDQFMDSSYLYTALTDMTASTMTGWVKASVAAL